MKRQKAFTLIELLIVIAIATIIAGGLVPLFSTTKQDAKLAKFVSLVDTLRDACMRYYFDTGEYAREDGDSSASCPNADRNLSCNYGVADWDGPYLNRPLAEEDNPFYSSMQLGLSFVATAYASALPSTPPSIIVDNVLLGFDIDGNGSFEHTGYGNQVAVAIGSDTIARKINDAIDKGVDGNDWMSRGRVRYLAADDTVVIYLFSGN